MLCDYLQAKIGKAKECEDALQRLRGANADISDEAEEIRVSSKLYIHAYHSDFS